MNVETQRISPAPIRKTPAGQGSRQKAFDIFVGGMGGWWLKTPFPARIARRRTWSIEPRAGGRWYEIGKDGTREEWGKVLDWEAPDRPCSPGSSTPNGPTIPISRPTVEVRFTADGDHTIVEFEHRDLERFGDNAEAVRGDYDTGMDGGWGELLAGYQPAAEQ